VLSELAEYQRAHADSPGATVEELVRRFKEPRRRILAREAVKALLAAQTIERYGQLIHLPGHEVRLSELEEALWLQIEEVLETAGFDQPRLTVLAEKLELEPGNLAALLAKLGRVGRLRQVSKAYFMLPKVVSRLAGEARQSATTHPEQLLTVGRFREATGVSRHMVMPLLEFFDRIGFTRRVKDGRHIRSEWTES